MSRVSLWGSNALQKHYPEKRTLRRQSTLKEGCLRLLTTAKEYGKKVNHVKHTSLRQAVIDTDLHKLQSISHTAGGVTRYHPFATQPPADVVALKALSRALLVAARYP